MPTPFDLPIANLAAIAPGSSENVAVVSALLTLMKEAHPNNYTPGPGAEPIPATIAAVEAKFGVDGPVARLVRRALG